MTVQVVAPSYCLSAFGVIDVSSQTCPLIGTPEQSVTGEVPPELLEISAAIPELMSCAIVRPDTVPVVGMQPEPCAALTGEASDRKASARSKHIFMSKFPLPYRS